MPQDGYLPFETSMISPKPPSCLESARAPLTASDRTSASTSTCGSGGGGVSPSGHRVSNQSRGLFPQDGYLHFKPSARYPKPPSCLESSRASLTARNSVSANTSHRGTGGGGVSLSGQRVPERSGGLFPQYGSLPFKSSVSSTKPPS